jgi:hypothetical protein
LQDNGYFVNKKIDQGFVACSPYSVYHIYTVIRDKDSGNPTRPPENFSFPTNIMKRTLLGSERAVWKRGTISLNLVIAADLQGRTTREELCHGWQLLQDRHPLLKVHIRCDTGPTLFVTDGTGPVPVKVVQAANSSLQTELLAELQTPFQTSSPAPLVRLTLLSGDDHCSLILTSHHCICDGLAAAWLMRDLLYCLSDQPDLVSTTSPGMAMDNLIPASVKLPLPVRGLIGFANLLSSGLKPPDPAAPIPMPENKIVNWHLDRTRTTALIGACRRQKITVHAAVATAFQTAQQEIQPTTSRLLNKIYTPVSVRQRLRKKVAENFGLYAAEAYVPFACNSKKSFVDNARGFQKNLAAACTDNKLFSAVVAANALRPELLDRLLPALYRRQKVQFDSVISNLGDLHFPDRYGNLHLRELYGPVVHVQRAKKSIGVLTTGNKMFFTLTYRPTVIAPATIRQVRDRAMELLNKSTKNTRALEQE